MEKFVSEDQKLIFEFDTTLWTHIRNYDVDKDVQKFSNSKIDFIGVLDGKKLVLMEVKNLRDRPPQAMDNLTSKLVPDTNAKYEPKNPPIVKEIIDCVKDSLLFIALGNRYQLTDNVFWKTIQNFLFNQSTEVTLLFCFETDFDYPPKINNDKLTTYKGVILQRLKASLARLGVSVVIADSASTLSHIGLKIIYKK